MKKYLLITSFLFLAFVSNAQQVNCNNICILNIEIDTVGNKLKVTVYNGDTADINYPVVMVVDTSGDTVGNINESAYFFQHLAGDTLLHVIPTTLDSLSTGFTCTVYVTDQISDSTCSFSYPMICTVGINEMAVSTKFKIFPNPASEIVTIESDQVIERITVCNILGERVLSKQVSNKREQVNISELPKGIYFVTSVSEGIFFTQKLVIE